MRCKKIVQIISILLLALLLIWGASLTKCEVQTLLCPIESEGIVHLPALLADAEYIKVLRNDGNFAKVYYVETDMSGGHVLHLHKENGTWSAYQWDTIWSGKGGSASGVEYPYIWHFIYGGI